MTKACIRTDIWSCAIGLGNNDCLDSRSTNASALQCPPLEVNLCTLLCSGMSSTRLSRSTSRHRHRYTGNDTPTQLFLSSYFHTPSTVVSILYTTFIAVHIFLHATTTVNSSLAHIFLRHPNLILSSIAYPTSHSALHHIGILYRGLGTTKCWKSLSPLTDRALPSHSLAGLATA